ENKNPVSIKFVLKSVEESGGIAYAETKMNEYRDEALAILHSFEASPVRNALEELVRYTTDRKY
ncbi:MAG: polyprenyl synthetase family protein, partial [Ferruginibacter sp.]|nr:polyprenyl synthetase family protein [Ferruginibacter sp.]